MSAEGMKVVNPMETIPEAQTSNLSGRTLSHYQLYSRCPSPAVSPSHGRRLIPNIISGCHTPAGMNTPYNLSKSTLEGFKTDTINSKNLAQKLYGSLVCKPGPHPEGIPIPTDDHRLQFTLDGRMAPLGTSVDTALHPRKSFPVDVPKSNLTSKSQTLVPNLETNAGTVEIDEVITCPEISTSAVSKTPTPDMNMYMNPICEDFPSDSTVIQIPTISTELVDSMSEQNDKDLVVGDNNTMGKHAVNISSVSDERGRHSSNSSEYSMASSHASVSSMTPLIKKSSTNEEALA